MKIAKLLAGIILFGCVGSLHATDNPPVPFIIGGEEVVEPSAVETADPLILPDEPGLPALDEPIAVSEDGQMLDFSDLESALDVDEPEMSLEQLGEPIVFEDLSPEEELAAEEELEASEMPFLLDEPTASLDESEDLDLPALDFADEVTQQPKTKEPSIISLSPVVEDSTQDDLERVEPIVEDSPMVSIDNASQPDVVVGDAANESQAPEGDLEDGMSDMIVIDPSLDAKEEPTFTPKEIDPVGLKHLKGDQEEWGPTYEAIVPPTRVIGPDGSEHVEGLEHVIGHSNPLLQEVKGVRRTIAEVGQPAFPALSVNQLLLDDLLAYLRNFTSKRLQSTLTEPLYVTMDIQPSSLEDVFEYLKDNYPVEIVRSPDSIVVVPAQIVAMGADGKPILPGDTLDNYMAQNGPKPVDPAVAQEDESTDLADLPEPSPTISED